MQWAVSISSAITFFGILPASDFSELDMLIFVLATWFFFGVVLIAMVVTMKNVINSARAQMTHPEFQAFVLRQAANALKLVAFLAAVATFANMALRRHE